ncbi:uncharacterized protein LOC101241416 isoform X2 [Hydra vulgaris]|uniref:Uncharacterized protein LOC101241416 isoform X2 n=1 Tax=Hydra vulgaris TaxID=6087 RepID=A0ABM4BY27_HYDVU
MKKLAIIILRFMFLDNLFCDEVKFPTLNFQFLNEPSIPIQTRLNDTIEYSFLLQNINTSNIYENNTSVIKISITIFLSPFVKIQHASYLHPNTKYLIEKNGNVKLQLEELELSRKAYFNFTARISDEFLLPGFHNVLSVVKLSYDYFSPVKERSTDITEQSFIEKLPIVIQGCESPLGMTDGTISFYQFSYSSAYEDLLPDNARFDKDAWCASKNDDKQYVEVLFQSKSKITAISTWGRKTFASWVKRYKLMFSDDGVKWEYYSENGYGAKIFISNIDQNTEVKQWLLKAITANYLRIQPIDWHEAICLRFELYGCQQSTVKNCINPLSTEISKEFLKNQKTASTSIEYKSAEENDFGWKVVASSEWLQVYLGSIYMLTKIVLQGFHNRNVSSYLLHQLNIGYSNNTKDWSYTSKKNQHIDGYLKITLRNDTFFIELPPGVVGRYLRIILNDTLFSKVIVTELYGCLIEKNLQHKSVLSFSSKLKLSRRSILLDSNQQLFVCLYNDNRLSPCCRKTLDGKNWKDMPSNVMSIISYLNKTGKVFAVDRDMNILINRYGSDEWQSVSKEEWDQVENSEHLLKALNIEDILPYNEPIDALTIKSGKHIWGVSNKGVHLKLQGEWRLVSSWVCCE